MNRARSFEVVRYGLVGIASLILSWSLFGVLEWLIRSPSGYLVASTVVPLAVIPVTYLAHSRLTFRVRFSLTGFLGYLGVQAFLPLVSPVAMYFLVEKMGVKPSVGYFAWLVTTAVFSFLLSSQIVGRRSG